MGTIIMACAYLFQCQIAVPTDDICHLVNLAVYLD